MSTTKPGIRPWLLRHAPARRRLWTPWHARISALFTTSPSEWCETRMTPLIRVIFILGSIFNVSSTIAAEIVCISPANFRKQLSRAKADLFQFMKDKCGLINPNNPCRCYKKTKGFIREGKVDALTQQFIPKVTGTIESIVGRKNEELDVLMEGKYLGLFRSQSYHEEDLVEKVLQDENVRNLFQ